MGPPDFQEPLQPLKGRMAPWSPPASSAQLLALGSSFRGLRWWYPDTWWSVDAPGLMPALLLGFGEQKREEALDERKRRWWENGKGNFKDVESSQKEGDRWR